MTVSIFVALPRVSTQNTSTHGGPDEPKQIRSKHLGDRSNKSGTSRIEMNSHLDVEGTLSFQPDDVESTLNYRRIRFFL